MKIARSIAGLFVVAAFLSLSLPAQDSVSSLEVVLTPSSGGPVITAPVAEDGSFHFDSIPNGDFQLRVLPTVNKKGIVSPRDAASGLPTGRRQYNPIKFHVTLDSGSTSLVDQTVSADEWAKQVPIKVSVRESPSKASLGRTSVREMARDKYSHTGHVTLIK